MKLKIKKEKILIGDIRELVAVLEVDSNILQRKTYKLEDLVQLTPKAPLPHYIYETQLVV